MLSRTPKGERTILSWWRLDVLGRSVYIDSAVIKPILYIHQVLVKRYAPEPVLQFCRHKKKKRDLVEQVDKVSFAI